MEHVKPPEREAWVRRVFNGLLARIGWLPPETTPLPYPMRKSFSDAKDYPKQEPDD